MLLLSNHDPAPVFPAAVPKGISRGLRYHLGLLFLLGTASLVSLSLVFMRHHVSGVSRYYGLIWNLFLAWIPLVFAYGARHYAWNKRHIRYAAPVLAFLWFIFFPNAPYLLTDLQHLRKNVPFVPIWYDVILMIWFSWTGLLLGVVSLHLMQDTVNRLFGGLTGWLFVFSVSGAAAMGVFLGRFLRLNSWDIFHHPLHTLNAALSLTLDPGKGSIGFIAAYTGFFIFVYMTIHVFGRLQQEED